MTIKYRYLPSYESINQTNRRTTRRITRELHVFLCRCLGIDSTSAAGVEVLSDEKYSILKGSDVNNCDKTPISIITN